MSLRARRYLARWRIARGAWERPRSNFPDRSHARRGAAKGPLRRRSVGASFSENVTRSGYPVIAAQPSRSRKPARMRRLCYRAIPFHTGRHRAFWSEMGYGVARLPMQRLKVTVMLIRFSVENYLSFRDRVELSMVASKKVRKHPEHVIKPATSSGIPLLKLAVLYGANAAGKSNLLKAMAIAKALVTRPLEADRAIPIVPFKLDQSCGDKPSRFEFEIKVGERYYSYGFSLTSRRIEEEWLFDIDQKTDRKIFERTRGKFDFGQLNFADKDEKQFLTFVARGTIANRLFLTECRERNVRENVSAVNEIFEVLSWFEQTFAFVLPDTRLRSMWVNNEGDADHRAQLARYLKCFDTGIAAIDIQTVNPATLGLADAVLHLIEGEVDSRPMVSYDLADGNHWLFDRDTKGALRASKFVIRHNVGNGTTNTPTFEMKEESDGTKRLMDLVPAMIVLSTRNMVIAVDELDRSLHPEVTHSYLANFLKYATGIASQLIVTTHDTTLLSRPFLRRDEIWMVDKGRDQSSQLVALEEYKNAE